jgi:hypothetical protein
LQISFFVFLRVGGVQISDGMKTIDRVAKPDDCRLVPINPPIDLTNYIVAVLNDIDHDHLDDGSGITAAKGEPDYQVLLRSNTAGFIHILSMDVNADRMTVLSPCPGSLPSNYLLVGSVKWTER